MAWDIESLAGGGVTGAIMTVLTLLGWNSRLNKIERDLKEKQSTDNCALRHEEVKTIKDDLSYIRGRLDWVIERQINNIIHKRNE